MITAKRNIILKGEHNKPILTDVFYNNKKDKQPIVIFCHGYKGFKDWGPWDLVANTFAQAGFFFIKFNFSHNGGTIEQPMDFPDLDAFGTNNYLIELDDLKCVLDQVTSVSFEYQQYVNPNNIVLIGHSRAGGITTIKASEDSRISKLITWAGVSDYESRFPKGATFQSWKDEGVFYVENGRTKQKMPHDFQFYTTFVENKERLTIAKAAKNVKVPYLIIHGTEDPTVSMKEAEDLNSWNPNSELYLVSGADHVFGAKHPWSQEKMPEDLSTITKKSIEFGIL
ncbi:S9 family peptidase [Aquimarina sp. MMG015]|uniref:alpha/beta hydrolase family protein n=1 Tax=Aquimarina sp. MMG015 TaxID=2822689 RepID=UPI001FFC6904|nr:prolyl oligopeptidase family serine peptidase [Aquimarina sp. MMG015]